MDEEIQKLIEETKISSGSRDFNIFLEGGYEKGIITLFYGPAASGKSNFMSLACAYLSKTGKKVVFIDSEGGFSIDRIKQISGESYNKVLENTIIFRPNDFFEQKKVFLKVLKEYKSKNIGLIIVDSIIMFYRLELAEARKNGEEDIRRINSELAYQMKILYEIARKATIPIIITTQVYSEFLSENDRFIGKEPGINLVGGDILKYYSKCMIELQNKWGKKKAIIRKHRSIPEKELNFEICREGVRKKSWI